MVERNVHEISLVLTYLKVALRRRRVDEDVIRFPDIHGTAHWHKLEDISHRDTV